MFQLADIIGFVNAQPELTNYLEPEIASLTTRTESLRSRTVDVQGSFLGLRSANLFNVVLLSC